MSGGGDPEFAAFAALLRRGRDIPGMIEELGERLARAIPDQVTIERHGLRRHVEQFVVAFEPERFRVQLHGHRVAAWVDHVVRDVCVRSEEISVDAWLERLTAALDIEATRSTEIRLALEEALR
jgi:hypothetical protein